MPTILIKKLDKDNFGTHTDFTDIEERGELSHMICELELIRNRLLKMWKEYDGTEE